MTTFKQHYIVDEDGKRVAVQVDIEEYHKLLDALEELESIQAYDAAKESGDVAIPFDQAVREIESDRR